MSARTPIFVRIFKKESELEVWKRDRSGQYALLKTYPIAAGPVSSDRSNARVTGRHLKASTR